MKQFGIIGNPLEHSFSPSYFNSFFRENNINATYTPYQLQSIEQFPHLIEQNHFAGLNITAPFKETIIPYLDNLDPIAQKIGAVNTVQFSHGKLIGYNTDYLGFLATLNKAHLTDNTQALILGTGGASKAIAYSLKLKNIPFETVSRKGLLNYNNLNKEIILNHLLIINCTPLGMYPLSNEFPPIPYQFLTPQHIAIDLIYNPSQTLFLKKAVAMKASTLNGYTMLITQAQKAWEIWNQNTY
ncbi:MAG: shikimate dehydrogenase [Paludibacteraceae bacterium]|nr:shikimate dehydrogenase [Paludibacteraceae bacterium]